MKKTLSVFISAAVVLIALTLSGCGEEKKYTEAAALEAEGKYYEAYQVYAELGKKRYKDASQKAGEVQEAALAAAKTALAEGRYEDAEALAEPFPQYTPAAQVLKYARNGKNGSYVTGLTLSGEGKVSFTAAIGESAGGTNWVKLEILLQTSANGRASGTVHTAEKTQTSTKEGYFVPSDHLSGGRYVVTEEALADWIYDAEPRGLTLASFDELDDSTLSTLQMMQLAHFPIAYEAIMRDGTKGAALSEWGCSGLQFRDPMKTFAGGTLTVRLVSTDGKTVLFEQSAAIPPAGDH